MGIAGCGRCCGDKDACLNRKRVHRLWKRNGLKVPVKRYKKRRLGCSDNGCIRQRAEHRNHGAWDFIFDRTSNGRSISG